MPSDEFEHANGHENGQPVQDAERHRPPLRRSVLRALVQDFGPTWFTFVMNSGVLAILLHQNPYQFPGIGILSTIAFVLALILYVLFSLVFIARFVWFRSQAYHEIVNNIADLTMTACWPIAFMTLTSLVSLIVSEAPWGGYPFAIVAYVMWWFVVLWDVIVLFWVFITLIRRHDASDRRMPTTIIIPAVSVSTLAITGAVVSAYAHDISAELALPVIIVSFYMVGIGILLGFMLFVYLFHALLAEGWPPPAQTASMFIFVGPMGQSAAALQLLGTSSVMHFGQLNKGTFLTHSSAQSLQGACMLLAFLFNGLAATWMVLSIYAMFERAYQRQLTWNIGWNATIFPVGTLTTSTTLLAIELDSPAYRVFTSMLLICLVILFFVNAFFTIARIWQGKLLVVREDPRVKQEIEAREKER